MLGPPVHVHRASYQPTALPTHRKALSQPCPFPFRCLTISLHFQEVGLKYRRLPSNLLWKVARRATNRIATVLASTTTTACLCQPTPLLSTQLNCSTLQSFRCSLYKLYITLTLIYIYHRAFLHEAVVAVF